MKFSVGVLVVKTTGGPAMLVVDEVDFVRCQWVSKGHYVEQAFSPDELISLDEWMTRFVEDGRVGYTPP